MLEDRLQSQRFELKYIVREDLALAVREFVRTYLETDEFGVTQSNLSYPVHSLYLDSDTFSTYWHTINGNKNRYKLRLRFYENDSSSPVYFEIKRRVNDAILKQRGAVRRGAVDWLLAGHLPEPDHLLSDNPKHLATVERFCQLLNTIEARPKIHVAYFREAWRSRGENSARITMDRQVRCEPEPAARFSTEMRNPTLVFGTNVVLELKFTDRLPTWFQEMVRIYNLTQCSAAKYVDGIVKMGEHLLNPAISQARDAVDKVEMRREQLNERLNNPMKSVAA